MVLGEPVYSATDVLLITKYQMKLLVNAFESESHRIMASFLVDSAKLYLHYSFNHQYFHCKNDIAFFKSYCSQQLNDLVCHKKRPQLFDYLNMKITTDKR